MQAHELGLYESRERRRKLRPQSRLRRAARSSPWANRMAARRGALMVYRNWAARCVVDGGRTQRA